MIDDANTRAEQLHQQGMALHDEGRIEEALEKYAEALQVDSQRATTHYNIGLIQKYEGNWLESLSYNKKAHELDPEDESAIWNLGIAATALRRWAEAREAWAAVGFKLDSGDGPIDADFGPTPVRLRAESDGEVVWARRIDPVRAVIENIPLPESGFRYGDTVLHDGAAVGYRQWNGREYPVFNVLELFEATGSPTWGINVRVDGQEDIDALVDLLSKAGIPAEPWGTSVRMLCKACSEGRPHEDHEHDTSDASGSEPGEQIVAVAAVMKEAIDTVLRQWANRGRQVLSLDLLRADSETLN